MSASLVRIPLSVDRDGACKTNLRGALSEGKTYDYAFPNQNITVGTDSGKISTAGAGTWANSVRWAHYSTNEDGNPSLTYSKNVSTSKSGTLLFRMYAQTRTNPIAQEYVLYNGSTGTNGYAVIFEENRLLDPSEFDVFFCHMDNVLDRIKLNSASIVHGQWYQYSVKFETVLVDGADNTTVTAYENGSPSVLSTPFSSPILTPTGTTVVLPSFFGRITDFAILDTLFSNTLLARFGTAPFI